MHRRFALFVPAAVVGLLSLACGGGDMSGTYCHQSGDCVTLAASGEKYTASFGGGKPVQARDCGSSGCDFKFPQGTASVNFHGSKVDVSRSWKTGVVGYWERR